MIETTRPSAHESGHAVIGLALEFRIDGIDVFEGVLRTMCVLDAPDKASTERFLFLAGGIAGEKVALGKYDPQTCGDDQKKITERGGQAIQTYLDDAVTIIRAHTACFDALRGKIAKRIVEETMAMQISGGKNTFKLLSGDAIRQIWTASSK